MQNPHAENRKFMDSSKQFNGFCKTRITIKNFRLVHLNRENQNI